MRRAIRIGARRGGDAGKVAVAAIPQETPAHYGLGQALGAACLVALLIATSALAARPASSDRFLMYQLSYTDQDRAIALLTTFGYDVLKPGQQPSAEQEARYRENLQPLVFRVEDPAPPGFVDAPGKKAGKGALTIAKLDKVSSAVPSQRLLIRWNETAPEKLQQLLDLLQQQIDVAARQILVEAMVFELDTGQLSQLGFAHSAAKDGNRVDFLENFTDGTALPFTYQFTRPSSKTLLEFTTQLKALVDDNKGKVLSRPSVLVLDGHQAVITIGDKLPYSRLVTAKERRDGETVEIGKDNIISTTEYLEVDLKLNILPRANEAGSHVAMQVEALITTADGSGTTTATGAVIGPPLVTRAVETSVRVANDTPFVIGGLIRSSEDLNRGGIPYLSRIPGLGRLFRRTNRNSTSAEVIVIIIPHVIPLEERASGFIIAKDSDLFDHFDLSLFRNVRRVKTEDVFDLDFIRESDFMLELERWVEEEGRTIYAEAYEIYKARAQEAAETAAEREAAAAGTSSNVVEEPDPPLLYPPAGKGDRLGLAKQLRRLTDVRPDLLAQVRPGANLALLIGMLEGATPGEDKLVKRMLLDIIEKQRVDPLGRRRFSDLIVPGSIRFFPQQPESGALLELEKLFPRFDVLERQPCQMLELSYKPGTTGDLPFDPPVAAVARPTRPDADAELVQRLRALNVLGPGGRQWVQSGVLLDKCYPQAGGRSLFDHLRGVLVLKRLLDLNPSLPLTLDGFHVGLNIVFPTQEDLAQRQHIVDRETAALFYETLDYYYAFERTIRCVLKTPELGSFVAQRGSPTSVAPPHPDCGSSE